MIQDLIKFITARLDADEQAARAASSASAMPWRLTSEQDDFDGDVLISYSVLRDANGVEIASDRADFTEEELRHIALHDPAQTLADIAARRHLLNHWPDPFGNWGAEQADAARAMKEYALRALAQRYETHPEFRDEWRIG